MYRSILFHNLDDEEIDLYLYILNNFENSFTIQQLEGAYQEEVRDGIIALVSKGFLVKHGGKFRLLTPREQVQLTVEQEYRYISSTVTKDSDQNYLAEVKNYLSTVQKQLSHVETESRKSFLNLRTMVDKISEQGKEHLNISFQKAIDKNSETGAWVTIPHVSPIGLYEPIEEIKNKFKVIINELESSFDRLIKDYTENTKVLAKSTFTNNDQLEQFIKKLEGTQNSLVEETEEFSDEVLIALNEQINLLEKNLGKDLMEQFDAIERLNDLKPERIWLMLEETRSELNVYLNNVYSRILREINTLQLNVDISKVSLILTNEAGKAIKKVDKIQQKGMKNLVPLKNLLDRLNDS